MTQLRKYNERKRHHEPTVEDVLRELLRVAITYCVNGYCGKDDGCPLRLTDYDCQLLTKASELGVEVDG